MNETVLVYLATPPYVPGDFLPPVVCDGRGKKHVFPRRAGKPRPYVDRAASRETKDGTEYLLHVTVTNAG